MKLDKYTIHNLQHGRVSLMFIEPLTEGYELSIFMEFFKKYKKEITLDYEQKPEIKILGMICNERCWIRFLKKINADKAEKAFIESMRDIKTLEKFNEHLQKIAHAKIEHL